VLGLHQPRLRVDFEPPPSPEVLATKLREFRRLLGTADALILSDYGKGGLAHITKMIAMARRAGVPVLVDPKGEDYSRYRGATVLTPNRAEFRQVAGGGKSEAELSAKAQRLRRRLGIGALLITRSEDGMTLYQQGKRLHAATQAREVFDVSGAGDTVIAVLGAMLAAGAELADAVRFANKAAGIVVGKFGTAVVHPHELFDS
jgi:rfaE bifunctional protein kinase chain/domain